MADPIIKDTINRFGGDGVTTSYNFVFTGGYIETTHVRARALDASTLEVLRVVPFELIGPYQVELEDPIPEDELLEIYRLTPRAPLVNFGAGTPLSEANLDLIAKQALFVAAEIQDAAGQDEVALEALVTAATAAAEAANLAAAEAVGVGEDFADLEDSVNGALISMGEDISEVQGQMIALTTATGISISTLQEDVNDELDAMQSQIETVLDTELRRDIAVFSVDRPENLAVLFNLRATRALTLYADLLHSTVAFSGNPDASVTLTLLVNEVEAGTIVIGTDGSVTMEAAAGTIAVGDLLTLVVATSATSGATNLGVTLVFGGV